MVLRADQLGGALTRWGDPRITPAGRWLRHFKLDELPQLLNVIRGEMSLVGPRPEVPFYVAQYTAEEREVLHLTPGITDPSSLLLWNESELLAATGDPERCYVESLMPRKIAVAIAYSRRATVASDLIVIAATVFRCRGLLHVAGLDDHALDRGTAPKSGGP